MGLFSYIHNPTPVSRGPDSARHPGATGPALLETTLHKLTTGAKPTALWRMLQIRQELLRPDKLSGLRDPNLGQALVWWQLTGTTS